MPSIMAGVNQTMMLALSMVVIASMIGAGGLGNVVLSGIQRLDIGLGFTGGISVVILAIILDRLTQSFGVRRRARSGLSTLLGRLRPAGA
jgi:glycine betaine/proline transport system permease protein